MAETITPASVQLKAGKTQKFEASLTWSIEPAGVGDIDGNGSYTAPSAIENKQDVYAVAKDADSIEIGRAVITLLSRGDMEPGLTAPDVGAVIQPSTVCLKEGQKQEFRVPISWALEPASAPGKIDAASGEYLAPDSVSVSGSFAVVARIGRGEELGRSTVTFAPPEPPINVLSVIPEKAELKEGEQLAFRVEPKDLAVLWQASLGNVEATGVYTAPKKIFSQQTVILTAKSPDGAKYGNATVTLSNAAYWTRVLAIFWIALSFLLPVIIVYLWPLLETHSQSVSVVVNPPLITLNFQSKQQFSAEIIGVVNDSKKAVTWKSSDGSDVNSGVYTPPDKALPGQIQITATSKEDPTRSANATVYLTKDVSMAVLPSFATLQPSQTVQFAVVAMLPATAADAQPKAQTHSDIEWTLSRKGLGEIDSSGKYTAPPSIERTQILTVRAANAKQGLQAAANITLLGPQPEADKGYLIIFIIVMGMLGSVLHSVMSFTVYVGNRSFIPSWSLWYIFRPFVGGGTALFFFFLVGLGKVSATTMDPMSLGLVCGLVGLFSDTAIRKLAEIFNVILGTKEDARGDKLPGEAPKTSKEPSPKISGLDPNPAKMGTAQVLTITGANFREGAKVRVKSVERKPTAVSHTSIQVQLTQDDTAGGDAEIVVINADNTQSNAAKLIVSK